MTYLSPTLRLERDAMTAYILAIPRTGFKANPNTGLVWNPVGVVWHNTGVPSAKLWESWPAATKEAWGDNLDAYYKDQERWHSGPHFVGTPEAWSLVLCDPLADGVHDSCRNANYFGVETVGNAEVGGDDPKSGACLAAFQASANIIASLCLRFGWNPRHAIDFHRNCKADGHACPGSLVTDDWAIGLVEARIAQIQGAPSPPTPAPSIVTSAIPLPVWPPSGNPFFARAAQTFNAWRDLGVSVPFALAMVTQAEFESAFEWNARGDDGQAFNFYQWHWNPRGAAILAATGIDVRAETSIWRIVAAAWWELGHTETQARDAIAAAVTARDAAIAACTLFEGAGAPDAAERRGLGAERWSAWFADNAAFVAANPAP